jgi:hypothetical protein
MSSAQTSHAAPAPAGQGTRPPAAGTAYLALVHGPGQAVHGFALLCTALAVTAGAATAMAALSARRSRPAGSASHPSGSPQGSRPGGGCPGTPPLVPPGSRGFTCPGE